MTALQNQIFVLDGNCHGIYNGHVFPGIDAFAQDLKILNVLFADLQDAGGLGSQSAHVGTGDQFDGFNFQHGGASFTVF